MRSRLIALPLAAALIAGVAHADAKPNERGEAQIAKALAGRTPGKATQCIYQHEIRATTIIDRTAILYEMNNGTIYLNRPTSPGFLNKNYALVTKTSTDELCNVDIVRLLDTSIRMEMGSVGLGDFIPYARPPKN